MTKTNIQTETVQDDSKLFEQIAIEETPFHAVKMEDNWFLTMGKYRLTEKLNTLEECIDAAKDASWWRIMQIINIMITESDELRKINQNIKEIHTKIQE